jgi:nitroreductase
MNVYEAVTKRRSIRQFKDIPITYDVLVKCVNAARLAPTASNYQLCEYVIVDDEWLLPQVLDAINILSGVPKPKDGWSPGSRPKAYIITLVNTTLEVETGAARTNTNYDVGLAAENIVLVALEQGLGSCIMTSFDRDKLRQALNIPHKYDIAMVLALGFPDESPVIEVATDSTKRWIDSQGVSHIPKRRLEDITHSNRFPQ